MKIKILPVAWELLVPLLFNVPVGGKYLRIANALPETARIKGVWENHQAQRIDVVVEDESFPEVAPGCLALIMEIALATSPVPPETLTEERLARIAEIMTDWVPRITSESSILSALKTALDQTR